MNFCSPNQNPSYAPDWYLHSFGIFLATLQRFLRGGWFIHIYSNIHGYFRSHMNWNNYRKCLYKFKYDSSRIWFFNEKSTIRASNRQFIEVVLELELKYSKCVGNKSNCRSSMFDSHTLHKETFANVYI